MSDGDWLSDAAPTDATIALDLLDDGLYRFIVTKLLHNVKPPLRNLRTYLVRKAQRYPQERDTNSNIVVICAVTCG